MAQNNKPKSKGSYVNEAGQVVLSAEREAFLARISDATVRADVRAQLEGEVMAAYKARQTYLQRRDNMEVKITDRGFLVINGTGTKASGVFTKTQAQLFVKEFFATFKKLAQEMPEQPLPRPVKATKEA